MSEGAAPTTPAAASAPSGGQNTQSASAPLTQAGSSPVVKAESGAPEAGVQPQQPGKQAAAAPEFFELKVNGKVKKFTKDELLQHASLGLASDERFREGATLKKQAEAVIGKLKDPKNVITALQDPALGLSKEQIKNAFEEWYAREYIDPEQLSPEQLKLRDAEEKLRRYEDAEKQREEEKQKAHMESLTEKARQEIVTQIHEALESGKLPKTNFTMKRLAYWIERNNANKFDAPTAVLVAQVKRDIDTNLREMVQASDGEVLVQLMGDEVIKKIRKYDLDQLKLARERRQNPVTDTSAASPDANPSRDREREPVDVTARLRELQRTGRY